MEGLTVETCSLDASSRQTSFLCLLPSTITSPSTNVLTNHSAAISDSIAQLQYDSISGSTIPVCTDNAVKSEYINTATLQQMATSHTCLKKADERSPAKKRRPYTKRHVKFMAASGQNVKSRRKENSQMFVLPFSVPEKPQTAYNIFCNERRPVIRLEHCDSSMAEILKILGKEWSTLPKNARQKYDTAATEDLSRYKKEYQILKASEEYKKYLESLTSNGPANHTNVDAPKHIDNLTDKAIMQEFFEDTQEAGPVQQHQSCTISANSVDILDYVEDDDVALLAAELRCLRCNMNFTNAFNKSEHLKSRQHLRALKNDLSRFVHKRRRSLHERPKVILLAPATFRNRYEQYLGEDPVFTFFETYACTQLELATLKNRFSQLTVRVEALRDDSVRLATILDACKQESFSVKQRLETTNSSIQRLDSTVETLQASNDIRRGRSIRIYV